MDFIYRYMYFRHFTTTTKTRMATGATGNLLGRVLANSVRIAEKSAAITRDIMASGDLGIVEKTGIADLQTKADR